MVICREILSKIPGCSDLFLVSCAQRFLPTGKMYRVESCYSGRRELRRLSSVNRRTALRDALNGVVV
jgi:hypothetical protein